MTDVATGAPAASPPVGATGASSAPAAPPRITPQEKAAVLLLGFAAFLPLYAPQSVLPQMAAALGVTAADAGAVIGATTLAVALSAPVVGPLADRYGRKASMLVALVVLAPLAALLSLCSTLPELLLVRFLQGVALPALITGAVAYIADRWRQGGAAGMMTLFVTGSALGGFVGRFATGVMAERFGWPNGFLALAALSFLCLPAIAKWLPADGRAVGGSLREHARGMLDHLKDARIRAAGLLGACLLFAMNGTLSYVGFHLAEPPHGLTAGGIGVVFLVYPVGALLAPALRPALVRLGVTGGFLGALGLCAAGQAILLLPAVPAAALGICVFITGVFLAQAQALGYVGRTAKANPGAAAGLYVCCFYAGGSVGAVVTGYAWQAAGWPGCVALITAALGIGACALLGMREAGERPKPREMSGRAVEASGGR